MARKKKYKGIVLKEFKVGSDPAKRITYKVGDSFETKSKKVYDDFINIKRIK